MEAIQIIGIILAVVGALNWGLVGLFKFDLVAFIAGGNSFGKDIDIKNGFRAFRNKGNDWLIDREVQRTETFTGIQGINTQDRAVQETMGPIVDRSKEHLGQTDRAVIMMRRLLLRAIETIRDGGTPPGLGDSYYGLRAIFEPGLDPKNWRQPASRRISLFTDADHNKSAEIEKKAKVVDEEREKKIDFFIDRTLTWKLEALPEEVREPLREAYLCEERNEEQDALLKKYPSVRQISAGSLYLYDREYNQEIKKFGDLRKRKLKEFQVKNLYYQLFLRKDDLK
mgnify:CR=1 FL=1